MALEKTKMIKEAIKARGSAVIAFSGGVDSSTLAALDLEGSRSGSMDEPHIREKEWEEEKGEKGKKKRKLIEKS